MSVSATAAQGRTFSAMGTVCTSADAKRTVHETYNTGAVLLVLTLFHVVQEFS
jgi:hypothetical protein